MLLCWLNLEGGVVLGKKGFFEKWGYSVIGSSSVLLAESKFLWLYSLGRRSFSLEV